MVVKIKIDPESLEEPLNPVENIKISLEARRTLDGKIMILDHLHMDIIIDTQANTIVAFPKEEMSDEVYSVQNSYFKFLTNEGVILGDTVRAGNVFGSFEASYPPSGNDGINSTQVVLYSTKKFIVEQSPKSEHEEYLENEWEDHLVEPTTKDSTELGEVPEEPRKGSITPYRVRRYLSGYGYYQ